MPDVLIPGALGRLPAYGSNAPVTGRIPMYYPTTGKITYVTPDQIASGASAVDGPASATDNAVARFDGVTGKLIQDSAVTIADTTGAITIPGTTNQLILGTTNTTTISSTAPSASRVVTLPDGGASSNILLSQGAQTIVGVQTFSAPLVLNSATSITAFATGGQASATALTAQYNLVTTCASNFDSVKLLTAVTGQIQTVKNTGAAILSVFPNTSDAINGLAVNLSIDIPVGGEVTFRAIDATTWQTITSLDLTSPSTQKGNLVIKAANNAGNTQTLITNASQAAARTYSIPDAGASGSLVVGGGNAAVTLSGTGGTSTGTMTTLSAQVTSASITTAGGATHVATITYTGIASTDIVMITKAGGTNNATENYSYKAVCTSDTITVTLSNNTAATALNGTVIFNILVVKV